MGGIFGYNTGIRNHFERDYQNMIEINGKRNTAVVFADNPEREAKTRLSAILRIALSG